MQTLNLFKNYDNSLSDIHREYIELKKTKRKKSNSKSNTKLIIYTLIFLLSCCAGYISYTIFSSETIKSNILPKPKPKEDLRSEEEKLGYVKIEVIEFANETTDNPNISSQVAEIIKNSNASLLINNLAKNKQPPAPKEKERLTAYDEQKRLLNIMPSSKINNKNISVEKKIKQKPTPLLKTTKLYSILFENIDQNQYNIINKIARKSNISTEILDKEISYNTFWKVYRIDSNSKTVTNGKNVTHIKDFQSKEEAIKFAQVNNLQSIIKKEDIIINKYSIKLCCTKLDKAKNIAESSNIYNKTIKIIREK